MQKKDRIDQTDKITSYKHNDDAYSIIQFQLCFHFYVGLFHGMTAKTNKKKLTDKEMTS